MSSRVQSRYHESGRQFSPRIWRGIYIVGKVLTAFLFRALEDFIYVFIRPFLPGTFFEASFWAGLHRGRDVFSLFLFLFIFLFYLGRYGQCGTPVGEVIHRGALFCWFLVLIIIGLPLALIGCILRVVAVSAGKRDFTFVRPRGAPLQPPSLADDEEMYHLLHFLSTPSPVRSGSFRSSPSLTGSARACCRAFRTITLRTQNIGFLPTVSPANGLATPMKRVRALLGTPPDPRPPHNGMS